MQRPSKVTLSVIIAFLCLIIVIGIVYMSANDTKTVKEAYEEQEVFIMDMEQKLLDKDFAYGACQAEIDNLEQVITSKDELIVELQVKEQVLKDVKEILSYAMTYIHFIQVLMANNNMHYPEFIIESIMTDEFFEEEITLE